MKKMAPVAGLGRRRRRRRRTSSTQNKGRGLPKRTFKDRMTLGSGADQIDLYYFGRGHTNGDAWVLFPALRVVHAGDIFAANTTCRSSTRNNGGSGVAIPDTLMKAHGALSKSADTIITGHSGQMTFNDLRAWADFNRDFLNDVIARRKRAATPKTSPRPGSMPASWPAPANEQAAAGTMKRAVANAQNDPWPRPK